MPLPSDLRIALVADWLRDSGGAELVLRHLVEMFPTADIYTSVYFPEAFPYLVGRRVYTSFIQRLPFFARRPKLSLIFRPRAFENFDLSGYDLVISSSSAESKGVITRPETLHICYCHTPVRYYWSHYHEYRRMMEFGILNPLGRLLMPHIVARMRSWDYLAAQRVDRFIVNSETTKKRIEKYYRRDAIVIHPGIDTSRFSIGDKKSDYYFAIGRIIPYKKFDLLVDTFNRNGKRLVIATSTDTPLYRELRTRSDTNIEWRFGVSEEEKSRLYREARAFLFPQEEDFGLTAIEAMVSGTPVIAYRRGGSLETIVDGITGIFFDAQTPESLEEAIQQSERMIYDANAIRAHALAFDREIFQKNILKYIETAYASHRGD